MQQISNLPVFTGTIPNKATQNDTDFANNIFGFLNYSGNIFVADFNSTIGEFNTLSDEIELVAETIGANLKTVTDKVVAAAEAAEAAIAVLENGTINDLIIGENKAYSNQKINNLLETLDLSNIAETITLKHFTSILKDKLDDIAENANNYSHPDAHDASMITESSSKRFVSDTEKNSWDSKAPLSSPAFTDNPTAPTQPEGDNSSKIATTKFVNSGRIIQYKQFVMNSKETTMSTNYINSSAFLLFTPMLADSTIVFKVNVAGYINDLDNFMLCKLRSVNDSADIIPYLFLHKHIDVSGYSTPIACGMYKTTSWGNTQKEFRIQFASSSGAYTATLNGNGHGNILNGATFIEIYEIGA